jgi:hypothetical protein
MKRKNLIIALSVLTISASVLGLTACDDGQSATIGQTDNYFEIVYAQAQELGYKGTLEEFTELIKGEDGLSAYEIYKQYHPDYSGTEEEWINSLVENSISATPVASDADYYTEGLAYRKVKIDDENYGYYVRGVGTASDLDIVIPSTYNGLPVVGIDSKAFKSNTDDSGGTQDGSSALGGTLGGAVGDSDGVTQDPYLASITSIVIPDSVTYIGAQAFNELVSLKSAVLPAGLTSIGDGLFQNLTALESVTMPTSLTSIGKNAFMNCITLQGVDIASTVTSIGEYAFYGCASIHNLAIPDGVTTIEDYTFQGCTALQTITMPTKLTSIGKNAFMYCISLQSVSLADTISSIGDYAFSNCASFKEIVLPEGITDINMGVFKGCTNLESVNIPASVTTIHDYAFSECISLESIVIPATVTQVNNFVFYKCSSITIYCEATEQPENWASMWNFCTSKKTCTVEWGYTG